jgi:hypothetical protein
VDGGATGRDVERRAGAVTLLADDFRDATFLELERLEALAVDFFTAFFFAGIAPLPMTCPSGTCRSSPGSGELAAIRVPNTPDSRS